MGTMLQAQQLDEAAFRGSQFLKHPRDLRGNFDVLNITQPQIVQADSAAISRSRRRHHQDQHVQLERNFRARLRPRKSRPSNSTSRARKSRGEVADEFEAAHPGQYRLVAGSMGPTNRTASMSQDVNSPASRGVTFDQLRDVYYEQARGLVEGGADLLLVETIFDTLNAKAALFRHRANISRPPGSACPVMVSVTIVDQSGRTLSGQTVEAFWISVSHMDLLSVGINCALGAKQMRPYVEELSHLAPIPHQLPSERRASQCLRRIRRNAGIDVRRSARFCLERLAEHRRRLLRLHARAHPARSPRRCADFRRTFCRSRSATRGSAGSSRWCFGPDSRFVNIGERTNVTGSPKFSKLILGGRIRSGAGRGAAASRKRRADHRRQHGRSHARFRAGHDHVPAPHRRGAGHRPRADHDRQLELERHRGRAEMHSGQRHRQFHQPEGRRRGLPAARPAVRRYGAAMVVMAFDEKGQADSLARKMEVCAAGVPDSHRRSRRRSGRHYFRSEYSDRGDRHRRAQQLRGGFHRSHAADQGHASLCQGERRRQQYFVFLPRPERGARSDALRVSVPRDPGRPGHGHRERGATRDLRGNSEGPAEAGRRRAAEPPPGRDRTPAGVHRNGEGEGKRRRWRKTPGGRARSKNASRTRW